jgi:hypothetical protein
MVVMDVQGLDAAVARYGRFWSGLRSDTTRELIHLARADLSFRDPFNDLRGVATVVAMLDHLFTQATEVRFQLVAAARAGDTAFYRWNFTCRLVRPAWPLRIEGMSEVRYDAAGLVAAHVDHWDAAGQVYERLPMLGTILRGLRRRLAFPG